MDNQQPSVNSYIFNKKPKAGHGFIYKYTSPSGRAILDRQNKVCGKEPEVWKERVIVGAAYFIKLLKCMDLRIL